MNCAHLEWESRGARSLNAEEQEHVRGCANCAIDAKLRDSIRASTPPAELGAKLLEQARAEIAARPRARDRSWLLASAIAFALGGLAVPLIRLRGDFAYLPAMSLAWILAILVAALALAAHGALGRGLAPRGRLASLGLACVGAAALGISPGVHPQQLHPGCFAAMLGLSILPLATLFIFVRTRSRHWLAGACVGVAAGASAEAALLLHCPFGGARHMLLAHAAPWFIVIALGAALAMAFPRRIWSAR